MIAGQDQGLPKGEIGFSHNALKHLTWSIMDENDAEGEDHLIYL